MDTRAQEQMRTEDAIKSLKDATDSLKISTEQSIRELKELIISVKMKYDRMASKVFGVFGAEAGETGAHTTTPTLGSTGFGQAALDSQRVGSRVVAYTPTAELDSVNGPTLKMESISGMPVYKDKSHEELRREDYRLGDKGGPAPAGQSTGAIGFGATNTQLNPFASSSEFGQLSVNPFSSSTPSHPFAQKTSAFGSWSPLFGSSPFGASSTSNPFGSTSSGTSIFGTSGPESTPAFGASVFGSGDAFRIPTTPVFGSLSNPTFGAQSTPAFGVASTSTFGASSAPPFSFVSSPAFGQSVSAFGAQATTPTLGSTGFGQANLGSQRVGSRGVAYTPTAELDDMNGLTFKIQSISAMPVYKDQSHEELRWEDYQLGDKRGPAPAGQSTGAIGFGATNTQLNPFSSSSEFGHLSANPFSSSTPSHPFAQKTSAFGSSPFGASSTSNLFGSTSSGTTSIFGTSGPESTPAFGASVFGSGDAFRIPTTPIFRSLSSPTFGAQSTPAFGAPVFGYGNGIRIPTTPVFGSLSPPTFGSTGFGQAALGSQRVRMKGVAYRTTDEIDNFNGLTFKIQSISAMPFYDDQSHEELRWEHYQFSDKGGPAPAGQSTGAIGFGGTNTQFNHFASSSAFGQSSANPFSSSTPSNPFAKKTPACGSSSPVFGSSPFGASSASNPFGSTLSGTTSIFGTSGPESTPAFGASVFGYGDGIRIPTTPVFGSSSPPTFGAQSTPAGASTSTFGASSAPSFSFVSSPAFGQSISAFGAQATTPTIGSTGFGQAALGSQRVGSSVDAYTPTAELDSVNGTQSTGKVESISAMPVYKDKSHEELRREDYQISDKGGPAPAGQSTDAIGFGGTNPQFNHFASSSDFGQLSANPFSSSTPSHPFAQETPACGSSSPVFGSSPFGASSIFGTSGPESTPAFGASVFGYGNGIRIPSTPVFGSLSPPTFGAQSTPVFGGAITSTFGASSAPSFSFVSSPAFGQSISAFGAQATTPTLGSTGFGQAALGSQRVGIRGVGYTPTAELDDMNGLIFKIQSICAMPVYKDKSHEELRWEDYQLGDKGGPAPAGQSTGAIGFGFGSSPAFDQSISAFGSKPI